MRDGGEVFWEPQNKVFEYNGGMADETGKEGGSWQSGSNFVLWVSVCGPHLLALESLGVRAVITPHQVILMPINNYVPI